MPDDHFSNAGFPDSNPPDQPKVSEISWNLSEINFASVDPPASSTDSTYRVPKRFGIAGILAITTLMAILFGIIQRTSLHSSSMYNESSTGHPFIYVSLSLLIFTTCLVQMVYGSVPRVASMGAGAVIFPPSLLWFVYSEFGWNETIWAILLTPFNILAGMFFGYLAGTLTAGCFMLVDQLEHWNRAKAPKKSHVLFSTDIVVAELVDSTHDSCEK
jgi:hypothetical protein